MKKMSEMSDGIDDRGKVQVEHSDVKHARGLSERRGRADRECNDAFTIQASSRLRYAMEITLLLATNLGLFMKCREACPKKALLRCDCCRIAA